VYVLMLVIVEYWLIVVVVTLCSIFVWYGLFFLFSDFVFEVCCCDVVLIFLFVVLSNSFFLLGDCISFSLGFVVVFLSFSIWYVVGCRHFFYFSIFRFWYFLLIIIFDGLTEFEICFIFLLISLFIVSPFVVDLLEYTDVLLCLLTCVVYCFFYDFLSCRGVLATIVIFVFLILFLLSVDYLLVFVVQSILVCVEVDDVESYSVLLLHP